MWVDYLSQFDAEIASLGSVSSADVDYFEHPAAAKSLKEKLKGEILWPEDAISLSPNYCTVAAFVNGKKIHIDFMRNVIGVDPKTLMSRCVVIAGKFPNVDGEVRLALMHPLDCIQSRLGNIETLGRHDDWSLIQTEASFKVFTAFVRYLLQIGELKEACRTLSQFEFVLRDWFFHPTVYPHVANRVDPMALLAPFLDETAIDWRWREKRLKTMIARIRVCEHKVHQRLKFAARESLLLS